MHDHRTAKRGWRRAVAAVVAALALSVAALPAPAQTQDPNVAAATTGDGGAFVVPEEVIRAAAQDTPEAQEIVRRFLQGDSDAAQPGAVTARAVLMIEALKAQRPYDDPLTLVEAAGQVADLAREMLRPTQIMNLFVTPDFRPGAGAVALDFGTADTPAQPGFERVVPNDSRLEGANLQGVTRPDDTALQSSGIRGVSRLKVPVGDGPKRIILLTENLGQTATSQTPFGSALDVNGRQFGLGAQTADQWIGTAALATPGSDLLVGDGVVGGVSTAGQRGGVLTLEVNVQGGEIDLAFLEAVGDTFLTGIIIEPAEEESSLYRSPATEEALPTEFEALALESVLDEVFAEVVAEFAPEAGGLPTPEILDLPPPVFETAAAQSPI